MLNNHKKNADSCCNQGVWLTNTDVIRLLAGLIVYSCCIIMIGYCWGKRTNLTSSMTAVAQKQRATHSVPEMLLAASNTLPSYYASLGFFYEEEIAQQCITRLHRQGIETELQKCVSTSARGREAFWYQIVTKNFTNREELVKLVDHIRCHEHTVGDVPIFTC
jgi:hypothetical protein